MAARAELKSKITLDASQFKKGVKESVAAGKSMESSFAAISQAVAGYFSFRAIAGFIRQVATEVDNLKETALNVGAGYENWQAFRAIFEDLGQKAETGASALQKLNGTILQARGGTAAAVGAFNALGISVEELKRLDSAQAFARVAEGARDAGYSVEAMDAITDIFGARMVSRVMPALRQVGTEGFDALADKARAAGLVISESTVEAVSFGTREWQKFKEVVLLGGAEAFGRFMKSLQAATEALWRSRNAEDAALADERDRQEAWAQGIAKTSAQMAEAEAAVRAEMTRTAEAAQKLRDVDDARRFAVLSDDEKIVELQSQIAEETAAARVATEAQADALNAQADAAARLAEIDARAPQTLEEVENELDLLQIKNGELTERDKERLAVLQHLLEAQRAATTATENETAAKTRIAGLEKQLEPLLKRQADEAARAAKAAQDEADARERSANAARDDAWAKVREEEGRMIEENLTLDERRAAAEQSRKVAMEAQSRIQAQGLADSEEMAYWKLEQLKAERAIREIAEEQGEETENNVEKLRGQLEIITEFRDFLKGMTDTELARFGEQLKALGNAVAGVDFSGLEGLAELGNLKLPGLSESQAAAYVRALSTLVNGLAPLNVGNGFAWIAELAPLASLKLPGLSESQASAYVRALQTLVGGLAGITPQAGGLSWLADLAAVGNLAAGAGGDLTITMNAPPAADLMLRVDAGDLGVFKDLAKSAATIASAKGVIYE